MLLFQDPQIREMEAELARLRKLVDQGPGSPRDTGPTADYIVTIIIILVVTAGPPTWAVVYVLTIRGCTRTGQGEPHHSVTIPPILTLSLDLYHRPRHQARYALLLQAALHGAPR